MRRNTAVSVATLAIGLTTILGLLRPVAAQEEPPGSDCDPTYQAAPGALQIAGDPPAVGAVVLEDPLTSRGAVSAGACPTGRNRTEFVGDGLIFKVTGKCTDTSTQAAAFAPPVPGLVLPDGEVRLDVKVVSGQDRASFLLNVREQPETRAAYNVSFIPGRGHANIAKVDTAVVVLASRQDLAGRVAVGDWNAVAVRLEGQNVWVLLNDQPVLSVADPSYDSGAVHVGLKRLGSMDDDPESAAVIRNLRVSKLARSS